MTQCKSCGWISVELVNICECCGSFIEQPRVKVLPEEYQPYDNCTIDRNTGKKMKSPYPKPRTKCRKVG